MEIARWAEHLALPVRPAVFECEAGEAPAFRSWEDTVNVTPKGRVRIAWMPDDRPGEWMYHCHILEHHESGMMGHFEVVR